MFATDCQETGLYYHRDLHMFMCPPTWGRHHHRRSQTATVLAIPRHKVQSSSCLPPRQVRDCIHESFLFYLHTTHEIPQHKRRSVEPLQMISGTGISHVDVIAGFQPVKKILSPPISSPMQYRLNSHSQRKPYYCPFE